ncbi:MAG: hydrogenase iron-sulfur subunit, partial [Promethearchaeota archaeon]
MKIGLFICHCGKNISSVIDIQEIINYFKGYKDVFISGNQYFCSESGLKELTEEIKENNIERVVMAACSHNLHGALFRKTIEAAGINKFLISFANIREQNSWVHSKEPKKATKKAIEQVKMAIENVKLIEPLQTELTKIIPAALVIGGGITGIKTALAIADAGYKVYLIEKDLTIGGHMALFDKTFPTLDCSICILGPLMVACKDHPNIELYTYSEIENVEGHVGNFTVSIVKRPRYIDENKCVGCFDICRDACEIIIEDTFYPRKAIDIPYPQAIPLFPNILTDYCIGCKACALACDREAILFEQKSEQFSLKVGAIILATGYKTFDPSLLGELNYITYTDVITTLQMERLLNNDGPTQGKIIRPSDGKIPKKVSFILCVGSRNKLIEREYCSQVCCNTAIKQAILIKNEHPKTNINIYYNDIRAIGKNCEEFYNRGREEAGIRFIKSNISSVLKSDISDELLVRGEDIIENSLFENKTDLIVLATGIEPPDDTDKLCQILNISQDSYGFVLERHLKVRPSETTVNGIFLAGAIQGPKDIPSAIAQGESAAAKTIALISKKSIELDPQVVHYDKNLCDLCRLCEKICAFNAIDIINDKLKLISANCTGCGACAAMCHTDALYIPGFKKKQISSQIKTILEKKGEFPLIIGFLCNWCAYMGADLAGTSKYQYPTNIRTIRVDCALDNGTEVREP